MNRRLDRLEARQSQGVGDDDAGIRERDLDRWHRLNEKVKASVKEDPELYQEYENSLDAYLDAEERAKRRGEDPEEDPEVLAATRAYEQIERRLLDENEDDDEGRRRH